MDSKEKPELSQEIFRKIIILTIGKNAGSRKISPIKKLKLFLSSQCYQKQFRKSGGHTTTGSTGNKGVSTPVSLQPGIPEFS